MEPEARKAALDRYRSGENRILVTCRALDEGFDIPSANIGIVLSSSSGERQRIQRLGRILRNFDGKRITGLYYLYMESSSEPSAYMPETETEQTCYPSLSLAYDSQSGRFVHPEYEARAHTVLTKLKTRRKTPAFWMNAAAVFPPWFTASGLAHARKGSGRFKKKMRQANAWKTIGFA